MSKTTTIQLITTRALATELGLSVSEIRRRAKALGYTALRGAGYVFAPAQADTIRNWQDRRYGAQKDESELSRSGVWRRKQRQEKSSL